MIINSNGMKAIEAASGIPVSELMETAGAVEYYADWLETLAMHDENEKLQAAADKLSEAVDDIVSAM